MKKRYLVTGVAGFIGFHLSKRLLEEGYDVVGLDNINDYYSTDLKYARLELLGISRYEAETEELPRKSYIYPNFTFYRIDLADQDVVSKLFSEEKFDKVCHLAAQAGVRYSIENPHAYIQSNLVGFTNLIEEVRHAKIEHFVYASSSSVYGESTTVPFTTDQRVDHPVSLYAATKKANELIAHTYTHLYGVATTGLRFFTVYGPWGRPDMAYYLFTKAIFNDEIIKVFNKGDMYRDFTYIDDIVEGVFRILEKPIVDRDPYKVYNIGNNNAEKLEYFIKTLEKHLGKTAQKNYLPMQPGDVKQTYADVQELVNDYQFAPSTNIDSGLGEFVKWYVQYKKNKNESFKNKHQSG